MIMMLMMMMAKITTTTRHRSTLRCQTSSEIYPTLSRLLFRAEVWNAEKHWDEALSIYITSIHRIPWLTTQDLDSPNCWGLACSDSSHSTIMLLYFPQYAIVNNSQVLLRKSCGQHIKKDFNNLCIHTLCNITIPCIRLKHMQQ